MKLTKLLSIGIIFYSINTFSQTTATATLTSGGLDAGISGTQNTFYGYKAGKVTTSASQDNTFIGHQAGQLNTTGSQNIFIGTNTGNSNTTGSANVYIGNEASAINGSQNSYIGHGSGYESDGNNNTYIGYSAGGDTSGSNNVFIGSNAGFNNSGTNGNGNQLVISNIETDYPLIWGDFAQDRLKFNGKVGIGNGFGNFPSVVGSASVLGYNLFVLGGILTEEVRVNLNMDWADYVFSPQYKLKTLDEVETFIKENGHLENVPSAKQVKEDGIELGEIAKIQQEKIEELTLYIIEQNKTNEKQNKEIQELKALVEKLLKQ